MSAPLYDVITEFRALASVTTLRLSMKMLTGNWNALAAHRADLVIGADAIGASSGVYRSQPRGELQFGFCVPRNIHWHSGHDR